MVWLIIILLCLGNLTAQFLDFTNTSYVDFEDRLHILLIKLQFDNFYNTLLVYGEDCVIPSLFTKLEVPAVLVSSGSTNFDWNFSSLTLILSCNFQAEREENNRTLQKLQINRRLVLLKGDIKPESVCEFYFEKEQHNVAMVKENFYHFGVIYSCRLFQDQNYVKLNLSDVNHPIYIDQFRNMHGAVIRSVSDNETPLTIPYLDQVTGKVKYRGYVGMLINHFVEKVNATLEMQEKLMDLEPSALNITDWAKDNYLDIGMCEAKTIEMSNYDTISYPYLISSYCFMVPFPDTMPYNEVYFAIIEPTVLIMVLIVFCICSVLIIYIKEKSCRSLSFSSVLLNDICFRGFIAQPFPFPRQCNRKLKLIFMLICFSSLVSTTMYTTYLHIFMWGPPLYPNVCSFADPENSRYKLAIKGYGMELLRPWNVSMEHVVVFDDANQLEHLRDSFDDNYMYPVTAWIWVAFKEQQKLFAFALFYYSEKLCLNPVCFFSFPIRRHFLQQNESGLSMYWIDRSFSDVVRLKLKSVEDLSPPRLCDYIEVEDLF
ncbi:uncharacterized protein LOC26525956 isoform X2 [Drosophila erecta]|uniref:uncharacterized protein LOC26525956 isoform X2 n=1 Tax=Drosophila erecta TaxID=7220 RepID=UPI000F069A0F|nr:uncharacterized protein LOC26525956 isoform X2 [Drosophila erecta]